MDHIISLLKEGKNVVLDRYVYSGVAYSAAKETPRMNWEWCLSPDKGLLKPDLTVFLTQDDLTRQSNRDGFGDERYEISSFQEKVKTQFESLFRNIGDSNEVKLLNVSRKSIEEVEKLVWEQVKLLLEHPNEEFKYF